MLRVCMVDDCRVLYGCKDDYETYTCSRCRWEDYRRYDERKGRYTDCSHHLGNKDETTGLCSNCYRAICTKKLT